MTDTPIPDTIERELVLPHSVERVWAALTEPDQIARWFGDTAELDLVPGGAGLFTWGDTDRSAVVVETVEPPRRFAFWWNSGSGDRVEPGNRTLVDFTLEPDGDGTRLRLLESGFASLDDPARQHAANSDGWTVELAELEAYLGANATV